MSKKDLHKFQDITKFTIIGDNVLVESLEITETKTGLVRNKRAEDKTSIGTVISTGKGRTLDTGEFKKMEINKGDVVIFNEYLPTKYNLDGKTYFIVREEDIIGYLR